ncbi:MAG: PHP domain-containing protein [Clostridium sp.]|nr:PHP domain-containing protein [Clostridium sp.]
MRAYIDLHIHSALSPCSNDDMTPNNISNMAFLKGLDIIALTDHNSAENCDALIKCAQKRKIIMVPGMELETREEVHLLCLFPGIEEALKMQELVYGLLPNIKNREDVFGKQIVMDENDNVLRNVDRLLLTASSLSIEDAFSAVLSLGGAVIPAHINRESYSIISNLGTIPKIAGLKYLEVTKTCNISNYLEQNPLLREYNLMKSSDAHALGDILERVSFIDLEEISLRCLLQTLR